MQVDSRQNGVASTLVPFIIAGVIAFLSSKRTYTEMLVFVECLLNLAAIKLLGCE